MGPTWGPSGADRTQVGPMNFAIWVGHHCSGDGFSPVWHQSFTPTNADLLSIKLPIKRTCFSESLIIVKLLVFLKEMPFPKCPSSFCSYLNVLNSSFWKLLCSFHLCFSYNTSQEPTEALRFMMYSVSNDMGNHWSMWAYRLHLSSLKHVGEGGGGCFSLVQICDTWSIFRKDIVYDIVCYIDMF